MGKIFCLFRYKNALVIVADQKLRNLALFDECNVNIKLSEQEYGILERIGRSRKLGEVTTGKLSMQLLCKDPKTQFYYRKILLKHKLIYRQAFHMKSNNMNVMSGLYHLTRFYNEFKSNKQILIEQIVDVLKKKPNFRIEYAELREVFARVWEKMNVQKLLKGNDFRQYIQSKLVLNSEIISSKFFTWDFLPPVTVPANVP